MTIRSEKKLICRNDILTYACTESVLKRLTIVDRYIYRPIAHLFLPFINNRLSISPNQLSIISLFTAILSSTFFLRSNAYLGTIFFIAWAIFDCADGSLSRTLMNKYQIKSPLGEFYDAYAGYYVAVSIWFSVGHYLYILNNNILYLYIGILSSFFSIYSRVSYVKLSLVLYKNEQNTTNNESNCGNPRTSKLYRIYENIEFGSALPLLLLFSLLSNNLEYLLFIYLTINGGLFIWLQYFIYKSTNITIKINN